MNHPATTMARLPHALAGLMTPIDVSRYLGVPPGTLANWRYLGRGPAFLRVGRHVRYRAADVAAWVDHQVDHGSSPESARGQTATRLFRARQE